MINKTSKSLGFSVFRLSKSQIEAHIEDASKNSANFIFTLHSRQQMRERQIPADVVLHALRSGKIDRIPEPNTKKGKLERRMERFVAGDSRRVVGVISDVNSSLIIVTVF